MLLLKQLLDFYIVIIFYSHITVHKNFLDYLDFFNASSVEQNEIRKKHLLIYLVSLDSNKGKKEELKREAFITFP